MSALHGTEGLRDRVRAVIGPHLTAVTPDADYEDDRPLAELGLDSIGSVALLLDLESELGIVFPDDSLVPETFRTIASLVREITRLTAGDRAGETSLGRTRP